MRRTLVLAALVGVGLAGGFTLPAQAACGSAGGGSAGIKTGSVGHAVGGVSHASGASGGASSCGLSTRSTAPALPSVAGAGRPVGTIKSAAARPANHVAHAARSAPLIRTAARAHNR